VTGAQTEGPASDYRFLCFNSHWNDCGYVEGDPSWYKSNPTWGDHHAVSAEHIGSWYCDATNSVWTRAWPPNPPTFTAPANGATLPATSRSVTLSWAGTGVLPGYLVRVADVTDGSLRDYTYGNDGCAYVCTNFITSSQITIPVAAGHSYVAWIHPALNGSYARGSYGPASSTSFKVGKSCGGIAGLPCDSGEVCDPVPGQCKGFDLSGTCVAASKSCLAVYQPVCGCDGLTYSNDCYRIMARVGKMHDGGCP